jgi:hypothetical protein
MATDTQIKGALAGKYFRAQCPPGAYLVGFAGRAGNWIDRIAPICAPLLSDGRGFGAPRVGKGHGTSPGGARQQKMCRNDAAILYSHFWMIVGDGGRQKFVEGIASNCHTTTGARSVDVQFGHYEPGPIIDLNPRPEHVSQCPPNEFATGFHGRAGRFLNALGLICGPLVPAKLGTVPPSQAGNIPSALPTAPTINSPSGFIVKGRGKFKITPSPYLTGTHAHVQLKWLNPPPNLQDQSFFQYEAPMSLIAGPYGIDAPEIYLAPGTWSMRVRISQPKVSDWSQPVQFQYYLQNPVTTTKPGASLQLQRR